MSVAAEIVLVPIDSVLASPENDIIYHPVDRSEKDFRQLVSSIKENGILQPPIISADDYIISGHRRVAAARVWDDDFTPPPF